MKGSEIKALLVKCGYTHVLYWPEGKNWDALNEEVDDIPDTRSGIMYDGGICIEITAPGALSLIEEWLLEGSFNESDFEDLKGECEDE